MRKKPRERGMQPLSKLLHEYKVGDKVVIKINPTIHKGMPHARYQGRVGIVQDKRGIAFIVKVVKKNNIKSMPIRPEHLTPYAN